MRLRGYTSDNPSTHRGSVGRVARIALLLALSACARELTTVVAPTPPAVCAAPGTLPGCRK
jgi:hypothetical protein